MQALKGSVSLAPPNTLTGILRRLLPTLHIRTRIAAAGYSKVSRGLRFPLGLSGLCTRMEISEASSQGQWRSRYAIHARRHSNDKVFRYLKRVIVTPAVYPVFTLLEESLNYGHWADVTSHTKPYDFARS